MCVAIRRDMAIMEAGERFAEAKARLRDREEGRVELIAVVAQEQRLAKQVRDCLAFPVHVCALCGCWTPSVHALCPST